ncbi:MAG: hypothetical protein LBN74_07620 [Prevotella sp.]|jgi:hypothetical protein|nr:hypothetical protein [Prevotella sp.]
MPDKNYIDGKGNIRIVPEGREADFLSKYPGSREATKEEISEYDKSKYAGGVLGASAGAMATSSKQRESNIPKQTDASPVDASPVKPSDKFNAATLEMPDISKDGYQMPEFRGVQPFRKGQPLSNTATQTMYKMQPSAAAAIDMSVDRYRQEKENIERIINSQSDDINAPDYVPKEVKETLIDDYKKNIRIGDNSIEEKDLPMDAKKWLERNKVSREVTHYNPRYMGGGSYTTTVKENTPEQVEFIKDFVANTPEGWAIDADYQDYLKRLDARIDDLRDKIHIERMMPYNKVNPIDIKAATSQLNELYKLRAGVEDANKKGTFGQMVGEAVRRLPANIADAVSVAATFNMGGIATQAKEELAWANSMPSAHLTKEANEILSLYNEAHEMDRTIAQDIVRSAGESLPFMSGFVSSNPFASPLGNLAKSGIRKAGVSLLGSGIKNAAARTAVKGTAALAGDITNAGFRTLLSGQTLADAALANAENPGSFLSNYANNFIINFGENYTELLGEYFPGWRPKSKMLRGAMDATQLHGLSGEWAEEQIATAYHSLFDGTAKWSDFVDPRQQAVTAGVVLGLQLPYMSIAAGGYAAGKYQNIQEKRNIRKPYTDNFNNMQLVYGNDAQSTLSQINSIVDSDKGDGKAINGLIQNIIADKGLSDTKKMAAINYTVSYVAMSGLNKAKTEQVKKATKDIPKIIEENANPQMDAVVSIVVAGYDKPVQHVGGHIERNDDGTINREKSDQTQTIVNADGKRVPVSIKFVEATDEIIPTQEAIDQVTERVAAPIIAQQENEEVRPYEANETVRFTLDGQNPILGQIKNQDQATGNYIVSVEMPNGIQDIQVQPRQIINEDNIRGVDNGSVVQYKNGKGKIVQGTVDDAYNLRVRGELGIDGDKVAISNILGLVEETQEEAEQQNERKSTAHKESIGRNLLSKLNEMVKDYHLSAGYAIIDGTWDGDFRGRGKTTLEIDDNDNVVLRRSAFDINHLLKEGKNSSGRQELYDTSLTNSGGNGIPTTSNSTVSDQHHFGVNYKTEGVFRIPAGEFLNLVESGDIVLGNIEETEIVISPRIAAKYLSEVDGKPFLNSQDNTQQSEQSIITSDNLQAESQQNEGATLSEQSNLSTEKPIETIIANAPKQKDGVTVDYDALLEQSPEDFATLYESEEGAEETKNELQTLSNNIGNRISAEQKKLDNADSINKRKAARKTLSELTDKKANVDNILSNRYGNKTESQQEVTKQLTGEETISESDKWERENFTPDEIQRRREYGITPDMEYQTTYRGISETEWKNIQDGATFSSEGLNEGLTYATPSIELAKSSGKGKQANFVVEFKPESRKKMKEGDSKFDSKEYYAQDLNIEDVSKVYDRNGNVVYDSANPKNKTEKDKKVLPLSKNNIEDGRQTTEISEPISQRTGGTSNAVNSEMGARTSNNRGSIRATSEIESSEINQRKQSGSTDNIERDATTGTTDERAQSSDLGGNVRTIQDNVSRENEIDSKSVRERHTANDREERSQRLAMDIRNGIQDKSKQEQLNFIEQYAKENGYWVEDTNTLGTYFDKGGENEIYRDGNILSKLNNFEYAGDDAVNLFDRLDAHNSLFPQVPYTLKGFAKNSKGEISAVLEQPYIKVQDREATTEEIADYMRNLGFEQLDEDTYVNNDYEVYDAFPNNVLLGADGLLYAIDTQIRKNTQAQTIQEKPKTPKRPTPFQRRLNAAEENVHTIRDRILFGIASGAYKFRWKDEGVSNGLASELGLTGSTAERKARINLLSNKGYTPSTLSHHIWEETGMQLNDNDIRSEVIDVLNSITSRKQALEALENNAGITEEQYYQEQEEASEYELKLRAQEEADLLAIIEQQNNETLLSLEKEALSLGATSEQLQDVQTSTDYIDLIEQLKDGQQEGQTSDRAGNNGQIEVDNGEGNETDSTQRAVSERNRSEESTGDSRQDSDSKGTGRTSEEQRVVNEATAQIDAEIAEAEKELTTQQKELSSAKKRLGKAQADTQGNLFGNEQQSTLFDVPADLSKKNAVDNILTPIQQQIDAAQTNLDNLINSRDARIGEALDNYRKQGNLLDEIAKAESETDTNPTEAQKKAGNYKKGKVTVQDFDISVEQPKGSTRTGTDEKGKAWSVTMNNTYGYIRGTEGKDGDHIDVFLGDNPESKNIFVVDQVNPNTGEFDEHKVMLGFNSIGEAREAYLSNYEEGWQGLGNMTEVDVDTFRKWTDSDTRRIKPFAEYKEIQEAKPTVEADTDKKKAIDYIQTQSTNLIAGRDKTNGLRATNVVQNFENPKFQAANNRFQAIGEKVFKKLIELLKKTGLAADVIVDKAKMREYLDSHYGNKEARQMLSDLSAVNTRFNEELDSFDAGTQKGLLHLGKPLGILRAAGIKSEEIELAKEVLEKKLKQHNLATDDLRNLAQAIQNPIMVYEWGTKSKSTVIVTELTTKDGRKITIALRAENKGKKLEVNEVASIHGKEVERFLSEMENAKEGGLSDALRYVNKEKALEWLGLSTLSTNQGLSDNSTVKIIQKFENPKVDDAFLRMQVLESSDVKIKEKQLSTILRYNPAPNGHNTWVRSVDDIQTAREAFKETLDSNDNMYPDFTADDMQRALDDGEITMYSSKPIKEGVFITPSFSNAKDYAGGGNVYSKTVKLTDVAWIDESEGQYAPVQFMATKDGEVYGFVTPEGVVYLDPDKMNANTPIHEFGHLWNSFMKKNNPELWAKGAELIKQSAYWTEVNNNPAYAHLSEERKIDEAMTTNIGDKGESVWNAQNDILLYARFKAWLADVWNWIKEKAGIQGKNIEGKNIEDMTLEDFTDRAVNDLLSGNELNSRNNLEDIAQDDNFVKQQNNDEERNAGIQSKLSSENGTDDGSTRADARNNDSQREALSRGERPASRLDNRGRVGQYTLRKLLEGDERARGILEATEAGDRRASDRTADEIGQSRWEKERFLGQLEVTARENGAWIDDISSITGNPIMTGGESEVYKSKDGKSVIKVNKLALLDTFDKTIDYFIDHIAAHNDTFKDDKYSIIGIGENSEGEVSYILKQPFVDAEREATQEEIDERLRELGFKPFATQKFDWTGEKYTISDAVPKNVLVDKNGNLRFIDTIINSFKANAEYNADNFDAGESEAEDDVRFQTVSQAAEEAGVAVNGKEAKELDKKLRKSSEQFVEAWFDRWKPVKHFFDALRKAGLEINDNEDWYLQADAIASKINEKYKHIYGEIYRKPLVEAIAKLKVGFEWRDIENYAIAKFGLLERNPQMLQEAIAKYKAKHPKATQEDIDKKVEKDYSGLTAIEKETGKKAEQLIQEFEDRAGEELIDEFWAANKKATGYSLKILYESGYISKEDYEKYSKQQYYVPLRGHDAVVAEDLYNYSPNMGTYFSNPVKHAEGRKSRSESPFAFIDQMALSALKAAEWNNLNKGLYYLAGKDKTGMITRDKTWYMQTGELTEDGKPVYQAIEPEQSDDPETFKQNIEAFNERMRELAKQGKAKQGRLNLGVFATAAQKEQHRIPVWSNGVEYSIFINANPAVSRSIRGQNVSRTANRLNPNEYKGFLKGAAHVAKFVGGTAKGFMARNMTQRNPLFVASNLFRDVEQAETVLAIKEGAEYAAKFNMNIPNASGAISRYTRGRMDVTNPMDKHFMDFLLNGGKTGYVQFLELDKIQSNIEKDVKKIGREATALKYWKYIPGSIDAANEWAEGLSRFATYLTSREMGRSIPRSISDAKEVTVNFNRTGSGALGNALFRDMFLFVNPALQAGYNMGGLTVEHPVKMSIAATTFAMLPYLSLGLAMLIGGDDGRKAYFDLPEWERRANFCIYTGNGFVKIPLTQEFRVFTNIGDNILSAIYGKQNGFEAAANSLMGLGDLSPINPLGSTVGDVQHIDERTLVKTTPAIVRPFAELLANQNFANSRIYNEYANKYAPGHKKAKLNMAGEHSTPEWVIGFSKAVNYIGGGDNEEKGIDILSFNPDKLNHLLNGYFGGTYTTVSGTIDAIHRGIDPDRDVSIRNTPLKRFFTSMEDLEDRNNDLTNKYYDIAEDVKKADYLYKAKVKAYGPGSQKLYDYLNEHPELAQKAMYLKEVNRLNQERSSVKKLEGPLLKQRKQELNEHIEKFLKRYEERMKEAVPD